MFTVILFLLFFFFNDTATTEIYTLSLHDALPICASQPDLLDPWDAELARHGAQLMADRAAATELVAPAFASRARELGLPEPAELRYRSEEHTSELQSRSDLVCRLLLEKKKTSTRAASSAFGLSVITAWSAGPLRSKAAMRARHICTSFSAVNVPASNATLMSAMVADSKSIVFARTGASASTMVAARTAHIWRFFFLRSRRPPNPPFFPYTSLFR